MPFYHPTQLNATQTSFSYSYNYLKIESFLHLCLLPFYFDKSIQHFSTTTLIPIPIIIPKSIPILLPFTKQAGFQFKFH